MAVAALVNPDVSPNAIERFRVAVPPLQIRENLEGSDDISAAIIFGGDGTIHRHLPQLHQRKIPALVVPAGSGNDFAKSLGIASQEIALQAWTRYCAHGDNVKEIDLGLIRQDRQETLFCCVAGIGLDAEANRLANAMPPWLRGSAGYVLAALKSIFQFQPTEFNVQADLGQSTSRKIEQTGLLVAVGNAGRYGGGAKIAPNAQLNDGLLDICFVAKMDKLRTLVCFPTVFFGRHLALKEVAYFQVQTVRVETRRPLEVYADGEPICHTPVEISLMPHALKVIVPA